MGRVSDRALMARVYIDEDSMSARLSAALRRLGNGVESAREAANLGLPDAAQLA